MNTIFINSENRKTSKAHILMLKLTNELDLRMGEKIIIKSWYLLHMKKHKKLIQ